MSIRLEETFTVQSPPDRVWQFLTTPIAVVPCLPGAELLKTIDERTYEGRVRVKVGPITASYAGRAQLTDVDSANRRMQLVAEGKEQSGAGSARMTMVGTVLPLSLGASEVRVLATIDIAGKIMQYGRGLVESVSRQLFKQFADTMRTSLETDATATPQPAKQLRLMALLWAALRGFVRRLFRRAS